ncbi:hypothetical protein N7474_006588 [Penicillium riverlandense]|uniref:uncharacterized protein n=1 Tax=Penicillium riverlandense TaxID=1903569 RepID=UPI0025496D01|nr:uncharacterized protein N7474_006588 [Penicillium riverlandense]KAJ5814811.1 hypothetical protein N7474_006588 [Penicillium riverlandense]
MADRPLHFLPDSVTVTLSESISLIGTLLYLHLLRGLSYLAQQIGDYTQSEQPFKRSIIHTENKIIKLCLEIVPASACRAVLVATGQLHEDYPGPVIPVSNGSRFSSNNTIFLQPLSSAPSSVSHSSTRLPQCYPDSAAERSISAENNHTFRLDPSTPPPPSQSGDGEQLKNGSFYVTVQEYISSPCLSRPSVMVTPPTHQQREADMYWPIPLPPPPSMASILQQAEGGDCECGPVFHLFSDDDPETPPPRESPGSSLRTFHSDPGRPSMSSWVSASDNSSMLQVKRSSKYRSVDSYPGKFPVSETGDLAAPYSVRGRGVTSVRPFSDM